MGPKFTEDPLLMLARVAIENAEKETKKVSFISEGLMTLWPKKKRRSSVLRNKKGDKNLFPDHEKEWLQTFSIIWEENNFKNCFDHEKKEWVVLKKQELSIMEEMEAIAEKSFKNKILDQTGLEKTQSLENKVPITLENDLAPENKKRKYCNNNDNVIMRRKQASDVLDGPQPPPEVPEEFKKVIYEKTGLNTISDAKLVVQKKLEDSDCNEGQNRLSIPKGNLWKHFYEDVEKGEKNQMVNIIDPSLKHYEIKLSNWKPFYAMNGDSWKKIKLTNNLEPGMIMQLWGFRVNNELWFALVNLTSPLENVGIEEAEKGSDHGGSGAACGSSE
ncbi:hypothetical protein LIER_38916 [Lithospermum erythrorhizon]|uniref:B3 domain-containing protein n=1 Tax=Lithospermum erythrorhizon TaxID=34254 RepID=A0AAV3Q932_LITER